MNTNSILYSLKVWLTSVGLAPVMYLIIDSWQRENYYSTFTGFINQQIGKYIVCLIFGGIFSFLTWLTFLFIIKGLIATFPSSQQLKHLIAVAGILLTAFTFALVLPETFNVHNEFFYLMLANCVCIAGGSYLYKLEIKDEANVIVN
jgi:hypothetical protein